MTPAELSALLSRFRDETIALLNGRIVNARAVSGYDANNAYQQVIGRQEVHLQWLNDAIVALGGTPAFADFNPPPASKASGSPIDADIKAQSAFIERWSGPVKTVTHARNRKMLELVLGEMKEHLRVLRQAGEGRSDVLGRHSDGKILRGAVIPTRPQN